MRSGTNPVETAQFYKCHSIIRKIEKNEESAFADFSKLLFLKLLEEKNDVESDFNIPYSYRFHELAAKTGAEADQVMDSVLSMIDTIQKRTPYGEVLEEKLKLKNPKTFHSIVKTLSAVSFYDCSLDSKGAAFEYFVRATLKGKKLGQYFTPRELVQSMLALVGKNKIVNAIIAGNNIKILDPACGTGGFLVFLMQEALKQLKSKLSEREIDHNTYSECVKKIKEETFYGSDANEGVAASAKMNMIIAGDGHTNIQHEDSLSLEAQNWSTSAPDVHIIMTNPPFGTSETDSLSDKDMQQFTIPGSKGQHLFIQKMINCTIPNGEICTVIDEGVLNTDSAKGLRKYILQQCKLIAVVRLPDETFKPNKINVKSSLLYFQKREHPDNDLENNYLTTLVSFDSLGYHGSGEKIRGFDKELFLNEIWKNVLDRNQEKRMGYNWTAFDINISEIINDSTYRFDYKYWELETREKINQLRLGHNLYIKDINTIPTSRGKSPTADSYVDKEEGYAIVLKAGSNVSKLGQVIIENSDWIEKSVYDEFVENSIKTKSNLNIVKNGDVLLSSTGDGTLGKCCVYNLDIPAIADGHITIIRPNHQKVDPFYLADYLRNGFGAVQIARLYTGSTGLIELTPEQVDCIIVDLLENKEEQIIKSKELRKIEYKYVEYVEKASEVLEEAKNYLNR